MLDLIKSFYYSTGPSNGRAIRKLLIGKGIEEVVEDISKFYFLICL
jgi:hypothetical protein